MMALAGTAIVSYLLGGIPFSYLAGRMARGIDLREHGSGNLGASNTFRILGGRIAIVVLLLDVGKGFIPVDLAGRIVLSGGATGSHWLPIVAMFFAILGHLYSPYLGFAGGKGIATSAGAFAALVPWAFVGAISVFAAVLAARRIVSLASLAGATSLPVFVFVTGRLGLEPWHWSLQAVTIVIAVMIFINHRGNIQRLRSGTEPPLARRGGDV